MAWEGFIIKRRWEDEGMSMQMNFFQAERRVAKGLGQGSRHSEDRSALVRAGSRTRGQDAYI